MIIAGFTQEQASRLTGVSQRQLRLWDAKGFFAPSLKLDDAALVSLYSFRNLLCLKVINAIRNEAKIPFSELLKTKQRLAHLGEDLWARTTLYILGKRVVFEDPETGDREEAASGQGLLQIPLRVVTGTMEDAVRAMRERRSGVIGTIDRKRNVAQNQPVIAGTRIPVRSLQAFAKAGYSVAEINAQYPGSTARDVEAALTYEDVA